MRHRILSLALVLGAGVAQAQDGCTTCSKSMAGMVGVGVITLPEYVGSDEYRVLPIPLVQVEYKNRFFLGGTRSGIGAGVGAYVVRNKSLTWEVEYTGAGARAEKRGDALAGMGRRGAASFAGSGASYRFGTVAASASVDVGLGKHEGSYGTVGLSTEHAMGHRWIGGVSSGATFANASNMAFDFGISSEQSVKRRALIAAGDPRLEGVDGKAYTPAGGLKDVHGGASLAFLLTPRSRILAFGQGTRLSDEAAASPLVRARNGGSGGVAIVYGF